MKRINKIFLIASLLMFIVICNGYGKRTYSAIELDTLNVAELEKQANRGNVDAQVELGRLYYYGERGVKKDYAEAVKWFQKAVDKGNVFGKYCLGICYDEGNGMEKNYTKAYSLYKDALNAFSKMAEDGAAKAQNYLGLCYDYGRGTEENKELAFTAYKKAAEQGYARAQYNLGLCYYKGSIYIISMIFHTIFVRLEKLIRWYTDLF